MKVGFRSDTSEVWDLYKGFSGHIAYDIGANGGMVSKILAENFTEVVAFEPAAESFSEMFGSGHSMPVNVNPVQVAVSDRTGLIVLQEADLATGQMGELVTITDDSPLARGWGAQTGAREVYAYTLDDLVGEYGEPDFIKIDVEGHEGHVIRGGMDLLRDHDPILLIEIHSGALGTYIQNQLPDYQWTRYNHEQYVAKGSSLVNEHFWIRGEK